MGGSSKEETDQKKKAQPPQLVKLDKGMKLAEKWVNNMSRSSVNQNLNVVELEGRPSRLGIGAAVPRECKVVLSNDPVERKLLAKLQADKRKSIKKDEELAKDVNVDEESEEEDSESKTRAFAKKRPPSLTSPQHAKKKQR